MKNVKRAGLTLALLSLVGSSALSLAKPSRAVEKLSSHFRYETVRLPGTPFRLDRGQLFSLYLGAETRFIKTIFVKAETADDSSDVEVIANGSVVGRFSAMGQSEDESPAMIKVVDDVNSLEFRHVSGDPVFVTEITAVQSVATSEDFAQLKAALSAGPWPNLHSANASSSEDFASIVLLSNLNPANSASDVAKRVIDLVEKLRPYVDASTDYVTYLLPIKSSAGRAYSIAQAYGDHLSQQTRMAMMDLSFTIEQANRCLTDLMHVEAIFDNVVELQALKYEIDRTLI
jgi:hypothetical protein